MSEWTKAQEADFQALIHRASEQSRECYRRRKDEPPEPHKREPVPMVICKPELPCVVQSTPPPALPVRASVPKVQATAHSAQAPAKRSEVRSNTAPVAQPAGKASAKSGIMGGLKGLTEMLDSEGIMLAVLLWLLIEEKADNTIILAIAYILLV